MGMDIWLSGCLDIWIWILVSGYLDIWINGYMDIWIYGYMAMWMYINDAWVALSVLTHVSGVHVGPGGN